VLPGFWAGAYACWGTENREASVRFIEGGPANPVGANVEVKIVDPSANPYLASAAILGLAADGIERGAPLPPETTVDPATLSDAEREAAGTVLLTGDQTAMLDALEGSSTARSVLGDEVVEATLAVRRYEASTYGDRSPAELAEMFRMAWSV
jgi:glutamine synthetase